MSLDDIIMANSLIYRSVGKMITLIKFIQEVAIFVPKLLKKSLKREGEVAKSSYKIAKLATLSATLIDVPLENTIICVQDIVNKISALIFSFTTIF